MKRLKNILFVIQFYGLFIVVKLLTFYYKFVGFKNASKDIIYLESFTEDGAGYNYRVKHWKDLLELDRYTVESVFIIRYAKDFFKQTAPENLQKFLIKSILKRIKQIHHSRNFKHVIVRRNILVYCQYGDLFMEKLLMAAHPNRILDFDDDIGSETNTGEKSLFQKIMLTVNNQFYSSFCYYNGFMPGSTYLKMLLKNNNNQIDDYNICVIPTCVHYTKYAAKKYNFNIEEVKFGWIGGNQNLGLLRAIIPAMNNVAKNTKIRLLVIAGVQTYDLGAEFPVDFKLFSLETEVDLLKTIDIGLMPLQNNATSRGKCGFKLLQYMGLGIPGIASAITVNNDIIEDNVNGWLVNPVNDDWTDALNKAISNLKNIQSIGNKARDTVEKRYSFEANYMNYKNFINR